MLSRDTSSSNLCFLSFVGIPSHHYFPNPHRQRNPLRAHFFLFHSRFSFFLNLLKYCIEFLHRIAFLAAYRLRKCVVVSSFSFTRGLVIQERRARFFLFHARAAYRLRNWDGTKLTWARSFFHRSAFLYQPTSSCFFLFSFTPPF